MVEEHSVYSREVLGTSTLGLFEMLAKMQITGPYSSTYNGVMS